MGLLVGNDMGALAFAIPQSCPSVEQLQANGVTMAMQDPESPSDWVGMNPSHAFGTSDNWSFFAGPVMSQNQEDALTLINQKISSLTYQDGPQEIQVGTPQGQESKAYACIYMSQANDFFGVTITPTMAPNKGFGYLMKMRSK